MRAAAERPIDMRELKIAANAPNDWFVTKSRHFRHEADDGCPRLPVRPTARPFAVPSLPPIVAILKTVHGPFQRHVLAPAALPLFCW